MGESGPLRPSAFDVRWGAATSQGAVRRHNEDAWYAGPPVFLVADGMGGHQRGEVASRVVVEAFQAVDDEWLTAPVVCDVLDRASAEVGGIAADGPPPGTTVVGVGLAEQEGAPCWLVFNVGDSRAYRLRAGDLKQISVDHSRVQQLLDSGDAVSGRRAASTPRNVITRAIGGGMRGAVEVDQWLLPAGAGDRVLLCSDGLTTEVSDQLIAATLLSVNDPQDAAEQLVAAAVDAGGHDNVTVVIVDAVRVANPDGSPAATSVETTLSDFPAPDDDATLPDPTAFLDVINAQDDVALAVRDRAGEQEVLQ